MDAVLALIINCDGAYYDGSSYFILPGQFKFQIADVGEMEGLVELGRIESLDSVPSQITPSFRGLLNWYQTSLETLACPAADIHRLLYR